MGEATLSRSVEGSAQLADARSGLTYVLGASPVLIGRGGDVAIPDPFVSRRHARITRRPGGFWLEDLASANGSYVNQRMVSLPVRLAEGDLITVGATSLRFSGEAAHA